MMSQETKDPGDQAARDPMADPSSSSSSSSFTIPILFNGSDQDCPLPQADRPITADEIALYDRQIRLWGMAAQAKIQSANILLITVRALANEIAKNLVLAGIRSLTLLDDAPVSEADLGAQFLLADFDLDNHPQHPQHPQHPPQPQHHSSPSSSTLSPAMPTTATSTSTTTTTKPSQSSPIGLNRAHAALPALQRLNPRVHIRADSAGVRSKPPSYFSAFDIIIATDLDPDAFNLINTAARIHSKPFYAAGTHGLYGFIFCDLIEHDFVIRRDVGNVPTRPGRESRTRSVVSVVVEDAHKEKKKKEEEEEEEENEEAHTDKRDKSSSSSNNNNNNNNNKKKKIMMNNNEEEEQRQRPPRGPMLSKPVEVVTKRELYSTWLLASDAALLPPDFTKSKRRLRSVSPALSCLRALWAFMQSHSSRMPSSRDDLRAFTQLATQRHRALSLPPETLRPEFLRSFLQNLGCEIAPTAAILGGQLAQDVINVLGHSQQPIQNMVIFDGNTMDAPMYPFHPDGPIGASLLSMAANLGPVVPAPDSILPAFAPPQPPSGAQGGASN